MHSLRPSPASLLAWPHLLLATPISSEAALTSSRSLRLERLDPRQRSLVQPLRERIQCHPLARVLAVIGLVGDESLDSPAREHRPALQPAKPPPVVTDRSIGGEPRRHRGVEPPLGAEARPPASHRRAPRDETLYGRWMRAASSRNSRSRNGTRSSTDVRIEK